MTNPIVQPMVFYRDDYCFDCSNTSIEIFDYFDKPLYYNRLVTARLNKLPTRVDRNIFVMRCTKCGKIYHIKYDEKDFPIPVRDESAFKRFMGDYYRVCNNAKKEMTLNLL